VATDRQAQDAGATVRSFVALVERRLAEFVEFGVKHTLESGARYRNLPVEQLRASVSRGIRAVLEDLRAGTTDRYAGFWREIAVVRARAGFPIEALQRALELNEKLLVTAAHRQPEPLDRLAAIEALHAIHNAAREALFASYAGISREIQAEQRAAIDRLGAPVIPVFDGVILVPLVGPAAMRRVGEVLLAAVAQHRARFVILDVTGTPEIDADGAQALARAGQGVGLLGAELLLVGISAVAAASLVAQGLSLARAVAFSDLSSGFEHALARMGLAIQPRRPG
jgi:rsbT co-antagonist protein RsbR